ncbi:MAG TPA: class I SAM-dependent methyltransferase [Allocoleopsis sp.]
MSNNWWDNFFDETFADLLLERPTQKQIEEVGDFLVNTLQLKAGNTVFDQCCGSGDIACELAKRGINIIGVDQCEPYINRARKKAEKELLSIDFQVGYALNFVSSKPCDAVLNWYTSFGYSEDDQVNIKMLKCAYESLKFGGYFILDYTNPAYIFTNFQEHKFFKQELKKEQIIILKESQVNLERGMFISTWTYILPDGSQQIKTGESRIYLAKDLKELLTICGFKNIRFMGDLYGHNLTKNSPRCMAIAQK